MLFAHTALRVTLRRTGRLPRLGLAVSLLALAAGRSVATAADGNRLTYLDAFCDPYYPSHRFPRLITPQWVGEDGVEAVVVLSIDDMSDTGKFETFLRPILERLKRIDGRAPVSIFTLSVPPEDPQLETWLGEGLSLEAHTIEHPCPLFQGGDFERARRNVDDCIDQLWQIPGTRPVAYRGPCSDVWNTQSPRFYTEIFNRVTPEGHFLELSSTVHHLFTSEDPDLPRGLVIDEDGKERFGKYTTGEVPIVGRQDYVYVNHISNYPYPYVIGRLAWEFPCTIPGDHQADFYIPAHGRHTVRDWQAALDATVVKQGVMTLVFHPHGKCKPEEIVAIIDYAVQKHGPKVKFLTLGEARERLGKHLLAGQPLRASDGQDNGVRVLDLDSDGFLDVVIGNEELRQTRVWNGKSRRWITSELPTAIVSPNPDVPGVEGHGVDSGVRFGVLDLDGSVTMLVRNEETAGAWRFEGGRWVEVPARLWGLRLEGKPIFTRGRGRDRGVRLRDVDGDGRCELLVGNETQSAVFAWSADRTAWKKKDFSLPAQTAIVDALGRDAGLRFVDLNVDGFDDVLFSNEHRYSVNLYIPARGVLRAFDDVGWTRPVSDGLRGDGLREDAGEIPRIVRDGEHRNNGVWFAKGRMWIQNEDTGDLDHHTESRSFDDLMRGFLPLPLSPEDSLRTIEVAPEFQIELVAAEPLVQDPIAMEWAPDGKLWVVEMRDYPMGMDGQGEPGGAIRVLEDDNGDGKYDRSTVFAEKLNFPSGVMPWRRGALISAAPDILYAEDTDGDGRADEQRVLFSGFNLGNQQHRVNGFEYGLDGWLYCANGGSGGKITSLLTGQVVDIRGRDFRIRPETGELETEPGVTEFGRHRDDWGNWFGNTYANWGWHFFLPDHYLSRNPHLPATRVRRDLADPRPLRLIHRRSRLLARPQMGQPLGQVTAPCSLTPYRDDLFGDHFRDSIFIGEVDKNVVRRMTLVPDGVSFRAGRAHGEERREFLASTDNWFRPTQTKTGPDGALYVVDMYRLIIEHVEYYPADLHELLDFRAGEDRGRIYRVSPRDAKRRGIPRLDRLDTAGLVAALEHQNGWQRDTAQRLLVTSLRDETGKDRGALEPLREIVRRSPRAEARLQALHTLHGLNALSPQTLVEALGDAHAGVRTHAIKLSEPLLRDHPLRDHPLRDHPLRDHPLRSEPGSRESPSWQSLVKELLEKVDDPAAQVRYQLAFSLGEWPDPRVAAALTKLAVGDLENEDLQTAVLSSAVPHVARMLETLLHRKGEAPPSRLLERWLALAAALRDEKALSTALDRILALEEIPKPAETAGQSAQDETWQYEAWQYGAVTALLNALGRQNTTLGQLFEQSGPSLQRSIRRLDSLFSVARQVLTKGQASVEERVAAVGPLGRGLSDTGPDLELLGEQLKPQAPPSLQLAAVESLSRNGRREVAQILLAGWKTYGPGLRAAVLGVLGTREEWLETLLSVISVGEIVSGEIGLAQQQLLLQHRVTTIRQRAGALFSASRTDRDAVVKDYAVVGTLTGRPAAGLELFRKHCAPCHRLRAEGKPIGPDLESVVEQPLPFLLQSILDPSKTIDPEFTQYTAITRSGRTLTGVIAEETPTSIRLKVPEHPDELLLRQEIVLLQSSSVSIMPTGIEQHLNPQSMADLIAWLKSEI